MNQTNNNLQNTRQKLKITRTSLKLGDELMYSSDIETVLDTSKQVKVINTNNINKTGTP